MTATEPTCLACGHDARLHAPIGVPAPAPGAKCCTCQCPGLELPDEGWPTQDTTPMQDLAAFARAEWDRQDNSADERAEGGA